MDVAEPEFVQHEQACPESPQIMLPMPVHVSPEQWLEKLQFLLSALNLLVPTQVQTWDSVI